ncbi:MAG: phosphatidylglycerol lysyltransferase domain-containing protein [Angelakisella sp.]
MNGTGLPLRENCPAAVLLDEDYSAAAGGQCIASYENLTELAGKAMKRKRSLIRQFGTACKSFGFEEITHQNIDAAFDVERLWQGDDADGEAAFVRRCFRSFHEMKLMGGILLTDQKAVGYSIAAPCTETGALILVLRAKPIPAGASAMLYRQTALLLRRRLPKLELINLGCCGGDAELQNRLAYRPMVQNFTQDTI